MLWLQRIVASAARPTLILLDTLLNPRLFGLIRHIYFVFLDS